MFNYKGNALDVAIAGLRSESDKLQNKVHALLIGTLSEWTLAKKDERIEAAKVAMARLNGIETGSPWHGNSVHNWIGIVLKDYVEWSEETEAWFIHVDNSFLSGGVFKGIKAGKTFYEMKPAPKVTHVTFTLEALSEELDKKEKRNAKHKEGDNIDMRLVAALRKAMAEYRNANVTLETAA